MPNIALILTALKGFTAFWSLILLAVSAAMISKFNGYYNGFGYYYSGSGFSSGNAVVASAVLSFIWFTVTMVFLFMFPESIVISLIVETAVLGFLWILVLGSVASLSTNASYFGACRADFCKLGSASVGLGWILWFLIFGILAFQVIYTMMHFGGSMSTWRSPMAQLLVYGGDGRHSTGGGISSGGIMHHNAAPAAGGAVPMSTTHMGQAPVSAQAPVARQGASAV